MLSTQVVSRNPERNPFNSERDDLESNEKIEMLFKHLSGLAPTMKDATLLEALMEAGVPSPMSVLQKSYAQTRNFEETRKINPGFEDSSVITCCTFNLGTVSPRNYVNEGIKKMTDSNLPSKKLIYLLLHALMNKKKCSIGNVTFPNSVIYIDELDLDTRRIMVNDILHLDRFTIASRIKEDEYSATGIPTSNRVVIRISNEVDGWFLNDTTGVRYKNAFMLPPFLNLHVDKIEYSEVYNLYVVHTTSTNSGAFFRKHVEKSSAKGISRNKAFFDIRNPVTGKQIQINAVTGREAPALDLPDGWTEYFDAESGNFFYYNKKTKDKQWEHPTIKYVNPDSGSWTWKAGPEGCGYTVGGTKADGTKIDDTVVEVTKNVMFSHGTAYKNFSYVIPCDMLITSSAITQWKIDILDFGGISPMILVGVVQLDDEINLLENDEKTSSLKYNGWFINCTGLSLYGTKPLNYENKPYAEPRNLEKGDNIICEINTTQGTLSFYVNDNFCGEAFVGIPVDKFLAPCVCMTNYKDSVRLTPPGPQN